MVRYYATVQLTPARRVDPERAAAQGPPVPSRDEEANTRPREPLQIQEMVALRRVQPALVDIERLDQAHHIGLAGRLDPDRDLGQCRSRRSARRAIAQ